MTQRRNTISVNVYETRNTVYAYSVIDDRKYFLILREDGSFGGSVNGAKR